MDRNIPRTAVNTARSGSFATGQGYTTPVASADEGDTLYPRGSNGGSFNQGRSNLASGSEVHYDSQPIKSIPANTGGFTGRDNAPR